MLFGVFLSRESQAARKLTILPSHGGPDPPPGFLASVAPKRHPLYPLSDLVFLFQHDRVLFLAPAPIVQHHNARQGTRTG